MSILELIFIPLSLVVYIPLAKYFGIQDIPNERSSHQKPTLRGIGIVFLIAGTIHIVQKNPLDWFFLLGFLMISIISFIDDVIALSSRIRFIVQILSLAFLCFSFYQNFETNALLQISILVFSLAVVNAFNFMDGINGITGLYCLSIFITLLYLNIDYNFISNNLLFIFIYSLLLFLVLNFRTKAIGFGGDVGSISLGFVILYCLWTFILKTQEWKYLLVLSLYGIDTIYTITYRFLKKEKIFKAHKLHTFQILHHDYKLNHLIISLIYFLLQIIINIEIVFTNIYTVFLTILITIYINHLIRKRVGKAITFK